MNWLCAWKCGKMNYVLPFILSTKMFPSINTNENDIKARINAVVLFQHYAHFNIHFVLKQFFFLLHALSPFVILLWNYVYFVFFLLLRLWLKFLFIFILFHFVYGESVDRVWSQCNNKTQKKERWKKCDIHRLKINKFY